MPNGFFLWLGVIAAIASLGAKAIVAHQNGQQQQHALGAQATSFVAAVIGFAALSSAVFAAFQYAVQPLVQPWANKMASLF